MKVVLKDVRIRLPVGFALLHLENISDEDRAREYVLLARDAERRIQECEARLMGMSKHPRTWDADDVVFCEAEVIRARHRIRIYIHAEEILSAPGFAAAFEQFRRAHHAALMHDALKDPEKETERLSARHEELKELHLKDALPSTANAQLAAYFHAWMGLQEAAAPVLHRLCAD